MIDAADVALVIGLALLGAGLYFVDWRLALIVLGVVLAGLGLVGAWRKSRDG